MQSIRLFARRALVLSKPRQLPTLARPSLLVAFRKQQLTVARRLYSSADESNSGSSESWPGNPDNPPAPPRKGLYVGNLFFEVNNDALKNHFQTFGPLVRANVMYDARGLSRGYGFVTFENLDDATKCVEEVDGTIFMGRRIVVRFQESRRDVPRDMDVNPPSSTIFVGNISHEMTDKDLHSLFRTIPGTIDVRVAIDRRTGQPRGFAHADFTDIESARKAVAILQDKEAFGRKLRAGYGTPVRAHVPRYEPADESMGVSESAYRNGGDEKAAQSGNERASENSSDSEAAGERAGEQSRA